MYKRCQPHRRRHSLCAILYCIMMCCVSSTVRIIPPKIEPPELFDTLAARSGTRDGLVACQDMQYGVGTDHDN